VTLTSTNQDWSNYGFAKLSFALGGIEDGKP
jgi:hypothetical protein